jgi:hypothetical protein
MKKVFKVLGFLFNYVSLFIIVYLQYTVFVDSGTNVEVKGVIIVIGATIGIVKFLEKRKNVLEIQDKNVMFRVVYTGFKRLAMCIGAYWLLIVVDENIADLVLTVKLFTFSLLLGLLFNVLGNKKKRV